MTEFTIKAPALRQALTTALTFAGTDDTLPVINAIRITSLAPDAVEVVATDRYVMSIERLDAKDVTGLVEFSIPCDITRRLLMLLPRARKALHEADPVEFTTTDEKVTVRIPGDIETAITFTPYKDFIPYRQMIDKIEATEAKPADMMAFTPAFLAKVCKAIAARDRMPMKAYFRGEMKSVVLKHGDDFMAIVMPVRIHDDAAMAA
jgi:DNA polymerase III sliding clamp (beta) subunit (PCNA family)